MFSSLRTGSIHKINSSFTVGCADYMWGSEENGGFVRIFYPSSHDPEQDNGYVLKKRFWLPDKK